METTLTKKQTTILDYLKANRGPKSPTSIGMACGEPYHRASSWACSGLKALVAQKEVIRHDNGTYELFLSW